MKKKPKRRGYACLKKRFKRIKSSECKIPFQRKIEWVFIDEDLNKIKWPTMQDTIQKKLTHQECQDLFLGHIHPPEDNLNYSLAKSERDHIDQMGESFVNFMLEKGEDETQENQ